MASITQTIPTYNGGISQQPDQLKVPGQVTIAKNVLPDVTKGLGKRPGGKLIKSISDGTLNSHTDGKWFHYYRDENEQYIGQIWRNGTVRMWDCQTGDEKTVVVATSGGVSPATYLTHTSDDQIQTLTLNDNTYICNRTKTVAMDSTVEPVRPPEAYIELKKVAYANQYSLNLYTHTCLEEDVYSAAQISVERVVDTKNSCQSSQIHSQGDTWYPPEGIEPGTTEGAYSGGGWKVTCGSGGVDNYRGVSVGDPHLMCVGSQEFSVTPGEKTPDNRQHMNGRQEFYTYYRANSQGAYTKYCDNEVQRLKSQNHAQTWLASHKYRLTDTTTNTYVEWTAGSGTGVGNQAELIFAGLQSHSNWSSMFGTSSGFECIRAGYLNNHTSSLVKAKDVPMTGIDLLIRSRNNSTYNLNNRFKFEIFNGSSLVRTQNSSLWASRTVKTSANPRPKYLGFRIETTGQSVTFAGTSYESRYNTSKDMHFSGTGWRKGDYTYVWMEFGKYKVFVEAENKSTVKADLGLIRPRPTPFSAETAITADSILGDVEQEILAAAHPSQGSWSANQVTQIGNGLYLTRPLTGATFSGVFNISTNVPELLNVFTTKVNDVTDLPSQCKHGMVIKVSNSETDDDDYYVKFFGNNNSDGEGVWEECAKPGAKVYYDKTTMPVNLIRTADGNFRLTFLDESNYTISGTQYSVDRWEPALVGDTDPEGEGTNPWASFVGKKISQMLFFRNRLCLLSDENIILSQPGDFFNFWAKTAMTVSNMDVIDLSCSSEFPAIIYDGIQVNSGLILFTKNQQFMLTTDSDILSPNTAKINALSTYNFNHLTNPISLGTTLGFLDNAGRYSRFFEVARIAREGEPDVLEQSKVVGDLFDKDLRLISNSRENSVILFSKVNDSTIYGYRYFASPDKRILTSWFTWELSGNIKYHCMQDDSLYVVISNGTNKDVIQRFSIKLEDDSHTVTDDKQTTSLLDDDLFRIHLDNSPIVSSTALTYNATTNKTTFTLPTGFNYTSGQLAVYVVPTGSDDTFQGMTANASLSGTTVSLDGNWKTYVDTSGATQTPANNLVLGYQFDMEIELPTIHNIKVVGEKYRADTQGSLIIHRAKLNLGDSGLYETTLKRTGKADYTELIEPVIADAYSANQIALTKESTYTIPIYERNTNVTLTIKSTHPSPARLYSMTWEGDYTNKFYQRV